MLPSRGVSLSTSLNVDNLRTSLGRGVLKLHCSPYAPLEGLEDGLSTKYRWLTPQFINKVVPPLKSARDYPDRKISGLYLRVQSSGKKTWRLQYSSPVAHRRKWFTIGDYPTLSVPNARKKAEELRTQIANGTDPAAEKRAKKTRKVQTFKDLWDTYWQEEGKNKKSAKDKKRIIEKHFLPKLGPSWKSPNPTW